MQEKRPGSVFNRIGLSLLLMLLLPQVVGTLWGILVGMMSFAFPDGLAKVAQSGFVVMLVSYFSLYCVAFPLSILICGNLPAYRSDVPGKKPGFVAMLRFLVFGIAATFAINLLFTLFMMVSFGTDGNLVSQFVTSFEPWEVFLLTVIVAPIMEEIVFRRFLYKKLAMYGKKTYMLVSALAFAVFHLNIGQAMYAFILGLIFAWIMYTTGKVIYPIILHMLVNCLGGFIPSLILEGQTVIIIIYSLAVYGIIFAGLVWFIVDLVRHGKKCLSSIVTKEPGAPKWRTVFLNPGMILYFSIGLIIMGIIFLTTILMSIFPEVFTSVLPG